MSPHGMVCMWWGDQKVPVDDVSLQTDVYRANLLFSEK